ncbi:hypothetical protein Pcinc_001191 [Petrolisthes cinctipes]|uniref:PiggyBac transposable element-derived protein domain-containing protein n=1 Tax=Petrolisthes cinctipes TaxID=88211 RepID=A0AAE1GNF1_PETCI|nr:hypothetical protein Pcinc_001191 [Petrolisthes cinctipes]
MAGRSEENTGSFDSVYPTALPGAPAPVTSTPRVQPARLRHAPARLSDSAIGRELENLADLSYGSDDLDSYSDTEWQADESTEEDACVAVTSITALPSTSALHDVSEVTAPVAIPSTSVVGGSLGDTLLSPIPTTSGVGGRKRSTPASTFKPRYVSTPMGKRPRRRLDFSSSSSSSDEDASQPVVVRGRRVGVRGKGKGRGKRTKAAYLSPTVDPDSPPPRDLTPPPPPPHSPSPLVPDDSLSPAPGTAAPPPPPPPQQQRQQRQQRGAPRHRPADPYVWMDCDEFAPDIPAFDDSHSGIQAAFPCRQRSSILDYFTAFFDIILMTYMMQEINTFKQLSVQLSNRPGREHSKMLQWADVDIAELYVWLALTMMMPHVKKHRLKDFWSTHALISTPAFGKYMSRDRYRDILSYLHFAPNMGPHPNDRLWKIRPVMSILQEKIRAFFRPFQKVVIDESLVLFRGRLSFIQYIPSKRHRFGIKFYVICDCKTGYVLDFILYSGTDVDVPAYDPLGFSGSVVKALMGDYLDNNHILYTDNYYTSPALSQFLLQHQTGSCGTIRVNRKGWPAFPLTRRGDCIKKKCGNMLAIKWHDKRPVNMLTTVNRGVMQDSGKTERGTGDTIYKPDAVLDYNINMRLVDKSDMMVSSIDCLRKTCKWYKKAFFHLDVTVLNCYILYLQHHPDSKLALREFELELISQLLERFSTVQPQQGRQAAAQRPDRLQQSGYMARHYLTNLPPLPSGRPGSRRCYVCRHTTRHPQKSKETRFWCKECCVPLCPGNCFSDYHILEYI